MAIAPAQAKAARLARCLNLFPQRVRPAAFPVCGRALAGPNLFSTGFSVGLAIVIVVLLFQQTFLSRHLYKGIHVMP